MRPFMALAVSSIFIAVPSQAQDVAARADSVMRATEAKGFSGVVRLARNGNVVFERGYGLANRAQNIRFTPATVVQIGSNTKDFTAVAILQLQDRGVLNVQDKLGKFFPTAPSDKKDITLWQLLTHRAGFPLGLGGDFDAIGHNILLPLGLARTGFHLPRFTDRDLAHGYRAGGEDAGTMLSKPHAADGPHWNLRGNGGMLSTAVDMHAFYTALFGTDRLSSGQSGSRRFEPTWALSGFYG